MLVRLRSRDHALLGEVQAPLARIAFRTFRSDGMRYERIADGADGMPEYRAEETRVEALPRTVTIINVAGCECGTVTIPAGDLPLSVDHHGVSCALYTSRDQQGRALYLTPESA